MSAFVVQVVTIAKHPKADKLELVTLGDGSPVMIDGRVHINSIQVVTGPHYREGQLGVYVPPGSIMPGHLAVESWLVGKGKIDQPYTVTTKDMRGIDSPGIFMGQWYCKDKSDIRSVERFADQVTAGMEPTGDWIKWRYWRDEWHLGQDVSADLGITRAEGH